MGKLGRILCLLSLVVIVLRLVHPVLATDPPPDAFYSPARDSPAISNTGNLAANEDFTVSLFTGAATYSYPIGVAPGRHGLQPSVTLSYDHQANPRPTMVGTGWTLTQTYIQRDVNYTRNKTTDDFFRLNFGGTYYKLFYNSTDDRFHTQEESYLSITNSSGGNNTYSVYWNIKTKDGTNYRLGYQPYSEQTSNQENYTVRWYLDLVNDTFNNQMFYTYNENSYANDIGAIYPDKITYNNEQSREVDFVFESYSRPDLWNYYDNSNLIQEARRLKEIQVKADSLLVRKYVMNYSLIDTKSFLMDISVYGGDNTSKQYSDSFSYYLPEKGWTEVNYSKMPYPLVGINSAGVQFADFNRDGYADIIKAYKTFISGSESVTILINNRTGNWTQIATNFPYSLGMTASYYICGNDYFQYNIDRGMRIIDLDNDGFEDLVVTPHFSSPDDVDTDLSNTAYMGQPNLTWKANSFLSNPNGKGSVVGIRDDSDFCFRAHGLDDSARYLDLNGDGILDILDKSSFEDNWIGNGINYTITNDWNFDESLTATRSPDHEECPWQFNYDRGVRFLDVNGDGLDDAIVSRSSYQESDVHRVYLNNGRNFTLSNFSISEAFVDDKIFGDPVCNTRYGVDQGIQLVDVNGDGFVDIVKSLDTTRKVYLNNGTGWSYDPSWTIPTDFVSSLWEDNGVRIADVDGDGSPDILRNKGPSDTHTWISNVSKPYLLKSITTRLGGKITIDYANSNNFNNKNSTNVSQLGFNLWVVSNITYDNMMTGNQSNVGVTTYNYSGGMYDYGDKEFRGFDYVSEKIDNKTVEHYFYQDDALKGKEYQSVVSDSSGTIYKKVNNNWNSTASGNYFINQLTEISYSTYDGQANNPKVTNTSFIYDQFGNTIRIYSKGDVTNSSDDKYELFSFANNTNLWIVDKIKNDTILGSDGATKIKETLFYYDGGIYGQAPTKGAITKRESWLKNGQNPITNYTYDSYGNLLSETDPRGYTTDYVYGLRDTTSTFRDRTVDALDHTQDYLYDLGTGNLLSSTDTNGKVTNFTYDTFGRITKKILPYDSVTYPTEQYTYEFDGTAPEEIMKSVRESSGTSGTLDQSSFYDGLGRYIQTKQESVNNQQIVVDTYYDILGRAKSASNPYKVNYYDNYTSPNITVSQTVYSYDPLGRVIKITNPDATTKSIKYDHWNISVLDENNHAKNYTLDSYSRILKVIESNGSSTYITTYDYDALDELIQIKDAKNNKFVFSYDSLGRKTGMKDPDLGTWNYTYDQSGNLLGQIDNRNKSVNMSYDGLNRVINKSSSQDYVLYVYDLVLNNTLSQTVTPSLIMNYSYDDRLRKSSEKQIIDNKVFTQTWSYDSMDRLVNQTLPSGEVIIYSYDAQGKTQSVGSLTNISYNERGLPLTRVYSNGLATNFTYDSNTFRLNSIITDSLQNIVYQYDPVGNTMNITDSINSRTFKMIYDALDRLISAQITNYLDGANNSIVYSYDEIGNMLNITSGYENTSFIYGGPVVHSPASSVRNKVFVDHAPSVTLISPNNNAILNSSLVQFNCSANDDVALANITLYGSWGTGWHANETKIVNGTSAIVGFTKSLTNGVYTWNCLAIDNVSQKGWGAVNWTINVSVDLSAPSIQFVSPTPANGTQQVGTSIDVNVSSSDSSLHYVSTDFDRSMLLWMRMENLTKNNTVFADESSYSINGTLNGNANITDSGKFGNGAAFDGSGDYVLLNDSGTLTLGSSFTISAWIEKNQDHFGAIVVKGPNTANPYRMRTLTDGTIQFLVSNSSTPNVAVVASSTHLTNNTWYHLVGLKNDTGLSIYINGVLEASTSYTGLINNTSDYVGIGGGYSSPGYFNGTIDEVIIFNRSLSNNEIKSLYNSNVNQYDRQFDYLNSGSHRFKGYAIDIYGAKNSTEERTIDIISSTLNVSFIPPTPANGSQQNGSSIYVNISSYDGSNDHYAFLDFDSSVRLWMRMDDYNGSKVIDLSNYSNNGTLKDNANISDGGYWGKKLDLDGNGDFINLSKPSSLQFSNEPFTVSTWAYPVSNSSSFGRVVGADSGGSTGDGYRLGVDAGINKWFFNFENGSAGTGVSSTTNLSYNQWAFVVGQYNGTHNLIYVNGNLENSTYVGSVTPNWNAISEIEIGRRPSSNAFNGSIDEVLIFGRALLIGEIRALYSAESNQYSNNFTDLASGNHTFRGYAVNNIGNRNSTEQRIVTIVSPGPQDESKLVVKDSSNRTLAWFGNKGNIVLRGSCVQLVNCNSVNVSNPLQFFIRNSTGSVTFHIDSEGNLCTRSGSCASAGNTCNPVGNAFIVRNSSAVNMSYVLEVNGSLCFRGMMYENASQYL